MGAGRPLGRQAQHLRPEGGQDPGVGRHRRVGLVERIEVGGHRRQRLLVPAGLGPVDDRSVADPDAEEEPARMALPETGEPRRRLRRFVDPEVEDAGGHHHGAGGVEEPGGGGEDVVVGRHVREPQGGVPEALQLRRRVGHFALVAVAQRAVPHSHPAQFHACLPRSPRRRS